MEINVYKNSEGRTVTTSLEIARVFGKTHNNVVEDIKKAIKMFEQSGQINTAEISAVYSQTTAQISTVGSATIKLLRDIKKYLKDFKTLTQDKLPDESNQSKFGAVNANPIPLLAKSHYYVGGLAYKAGNGEWKKFYEVSEQVFLRLAFSYTGQIANQLTHDYIDEFERMRYELVVSGTTDTQVGEVLEKTVMKYQWGAKQYPNFESLKDDYVNELGDNQRVTLEQVRKWYHLGGKTFKILGD
jgi:phage regulator Rha-like protein